MKYPRHDQLDVMKTIKLIPKEFRLSKKDNSIFYFLQSVISHILHKERTSKCTIQLSELEKLNINSKLIIYKKAHVKITRSTYCAVSSRKIGDKVFVVYPNGVVAILNLVRKDNLHICPKTK